jgi:hypothetical protein
MGYQDTHEDFQMAESETEEKIIKPASVSLSSLLLHLSIDRQDDRMKWEWATPLVLQSELQFSGLQFFNFFPRAADRSAGWLYRPPSKSSFSLGGPTLAAASATCAYLSGRRALRVAEEFADQLERPVARDQVARESVRLGPRKGRSRPTPHDPIPCSRNAADPLVKRAWPVSFFLDQ